MRLYQVDAFSESLFSGNPAAVCPLEEWLPDELMQQIASENNLAETAFFVRQDDGYQIRWFTPLVEVDLCGHATLASAHVLFRHLNFPGDRIRFDSRSGPLYVSRSQEMITLDFPVADFERTGPPDGLSEALGVKITEVCQSTDYLVLLGSENEVLNARPDFGRLALVPSRGIIITAPGDSADFVSRFFAPAVGINEDPVTGSAHTFLVPFWSQRLGKTEFTAKQVSARGGVLYCKLKGDRVEISGKAVTYLEGSLKLD